MAKLDPVFWYFWIGLLLVLLVMFARGGVLGLIDTAARGGAMTPALETIGLHKRFGALVVANDIDFRLEAGARHALIGPNGAGKTTFVNLITGRLAPSAGPHPARRRRHHRAAAGGAGASADSAAPSRSTRCSAACRCWRTLPRDRRARRHRRRHAAPARRAPRGDRAKPMRCSNGCGIADDALRPVQAAALRPAAAGRDRHRARPAAHGAAARRAGRRRAVGRKRASSST